MKAIQTAVLLASIFAPAVSFGSLGSGSTQESAQQPAGPSARTPAEVVNMLAAKLNLTENQKIKALLNEQQKQRYTRLEQQMRDHIESRGAANSSNQE
jgi:hypothetical protein